MENKNIFLDANILIDFIDNQRVNHSYAVELIEFLVLNDFNIFLSEDILTTIYYVVKEKKLALEFIELINNKWNVVCFGNYVIKQGVNISKKENFDFEDVVQCLCGEENSCATLISNHKKFFNCGINVYTAKEFLKLIKNSVE